MGSVVVWEMGRCAQATRDGATVRSQLSKQRGCFKLLGEGDGEGEATGVMGDLDHVSQGQSRGSSVSKLMKMFDEDGEAREGRVATGCDGWTGEVSAFARTMQ
jgi:hypothetical protein